MNSRAEEDGNLHDTVNDLFAEYVDRLVGGEILDLERIAGEHPAVAGDLIERLRVYQEIGRGRDSHEPLGTLGDYTLRRQIGRGGMGIVYEAWQGSLERRVALKVLPAGIAADDKAFQRFMREAKTAAKLSHANVVSVYGMGVEQRTPYFSMEYVEGETLAQTLAKIREAAEEAETPFGPKNRQDFYIRLAVAFAGVAEGLQHAHSQGVVHRDIKPSNLILDMKGRLRILDFGLAHLEGQESLTLSGDFLGTPLYMSPEQARRKKITVDHRTDVYSLGATLYEMLTLRPPFQGSDHAETLSHIIERDPVEPHRVNPRVPKDLETIVLKCLRKEAVDRFGTAEALGQDLRRFARGDAIEARPYGRWDRWRRQAWCNRRRIAFGSCAVLLALLCGMLILERVEENREQLLAAYRSKVLEEAPRIFRGRMAGLDIVRHERESLNLIAARYGSSPVENAIAGLEEALRLFSGGVDALLYRAKGFVLLERWGAALDELDRCLQIRPDFAPALVLKAALLARRGDSDGVERELRRARSLGDPEWVDAWDAAYQAVSRFDWRAAVESYGMLIRLESEGHERYLGSSLEARLGRGYAHLESGDYLQALDDLTFVSALWPDLVEPLLLRGVAYQKLSRSDLAEREFEEAFGKTSNPDEVAQVVSTLHSGLLADDRNALLWAERITAGAVREARRAFCLIRLQRLEEALTAARTAVEVDGKYSTGYFVLGTVLSKMKRFPDAVSMFRRAIDLDPQSMRAQSWLAYYLYRLGLREEAVIEFRKAIDLDPYDRGPRVDLSDLLTELGRCEEARAEAKRVIALAPDAFEGYNVLGYALAGLGEYAEAKKCFERSLAINDRHPNVYQYWGICLQAEGDFEGAVEMYRKAAQAPEKSNSYPWSHGNTAVIYELEGRIDDAFEECCLSLKEDPNYLFAHKKLQELIRSGVDPNALAQRLDRLFEDMEPVLGEEVNLPEILHTLALCRMHGGAHRNLSQTLELIARAGERTARKDPLILATLAEVQAMLGETALARSTLDEARALPASDLIKDGLERLRQSLPR